VNQLQDNYASGVLALKAPRHPGCTAHGLQTRLTEMTETIRLGLCEGKAAGRSA